MLIVNVHEVKTRFSYYLDLVEKGKKVVVAKRNIPVAEIKLLKKNVSKRALGQSKEKFEIPEKFFKPLPKSVINTFTNPR